ncbi:MAG: c-type cytochrome [Acidobacteriota bacterium]
MSAVVGAVGLVLLGCARGSTSRKPPLELIPNMDEQPKYKPQSSSGFFYNGSTMQKPVPGTIARGDLREDGEFFEGKTVWDEWVRENPLAVDERVVARGKDRYLIYCAPCHNASGDGRGLLAEKAHVRTADLLGEKVRTMPDGRIYHVISDGAGLMPGYRYPIRARDRWAIVAYVRRMQQKAPARSTGR